MFKKSLAAVALLGAFAGSAFAADVTLYGVVDEGFLYTHKDADKTGVDAVDKLELKSGIQAGSRWGLKGTEDLGNGLKVGFILESGFNADDGTQSVSGTMFNREASLNVMGPFWSAEPRQDRLQSTPRDHCSIPLGVRLVPSVAFRYFLRMPPMSVTLRTCLRPLLA